MIDWRMLEKILEANEQENYHYEIQDKIKKS